jgi:hypothetical protein
VEAESALRWAASNSISISDGEEEEEEEEETNGAIGQDGCRKATAGDACSSRTSV